MTNQTATGQRQALRQELLNRRQNLTASQVATKSQAICRNLLDSGVIAEAQHILAYWPIRQEVDLRGLIQQLWQNGQQVYLPIIKAEEPGVMQAGLFLPEHLPLSKGYFNTYMPQNPQIVAPGLIDAVLVPAVGFDQNYFRLGYGGGFYDRFLVKVRPDTLKIGMAYNCQIAARPFPVAAWDIAMDDICTETGFIKS